MVRGKFSESGMEPRLEWEGSTRSSYKGYLMVTDENAAVTFMNSTTAVAGPPARVKEVIDSQKRTVVRLEKPIPVHIVYRTVWFDHEGNVRFNEDIYGRDKLLEQALFQEP